jgi:phosphatidylglycerophosphatase A
VIKNRVCEWFATCSYTGYLPFAPGTWASALTGAILWLFPPFGHPAVIAALTVCGYVAAERARGAEKDPHFIVIDEMIGMLVATVGHQLGLWNVIKAFILFRAFDILKPYPIRRVERLPGAYGIIADDILAGVFANVALLIWGRLA